MVDRADAERATALISEYQRTLGGFPRGKAAAGPVSAHCGACGHASVFSGDQRGYVRTARTAGVTWMSQMEMSAARMASRTRSAPN